MSWDWIWVVAVITLCFLLSPQLVVMVVVALPGIRGDHVGNTGLGWWVVGGRKEVRWAGLDLKSNNPKPDGRGTTL
jgi:hypothetical protein